MRKYKSRSKNSSNGIYEDGEAYSDEDLLEDDDDVQYVYHNWEEDGEI